MGYDMCMREYSFHILAKNKENALAAIKALADKDTHYAWVSTENFVRAKSLPEATKVWGWHIEEDPESGNIVGIDFFGEKLGDDKILLDAIAPFVEPGSFIEMSGEDSAIWRWAFNGKICIEVEPDIIWTYPEGFLENES